MDTLEPISNDYTEPLLRAGFDLKRGWNDTVASELVTLSHQPHITHMTPNDTLKRFRSVASAREWYDAHHRVIYTLSQRAVAGLIWFGASHSDQVPGDYTFAIRMYSEAQGQGLARPFMNAAHADFLETTQYKDEIWLDTATTNEAAIALYEKTGYVASKVVDGRLYMTRTA